MKLQKAIKLVILIFLLVFQLTQQGFAQKKWYKGNTHSHTYHSDGRLSPTEVVDLYKNEGYHFLFITDHGKVAPIDASEFTDPSFLCILGEESESFHHLSCLNINKTIYSVFPPQIIESTIEQGGFLVVNHPVRGNHEVYTRDVWDIDEFKHIEIYNSKSEKDGYHDEQYLWDSLLTAGKFFYGVAADDFHDTKHLAQGWIMVQTETLQKDSIINAIKRGDFYSSSGISFSEIEVSDTSIKVSAPDAIKIDFIGNNRTYLQTTNGNTATYTIIGNEGYVRVEASNRYGKKAWSQPLFWNKTFKGTKADTTIAEEVCEGIDYRKDGIYYRTEKSISGSDSIIKIHRSIIQAPRVLTRTYASIKLGDTLSISSVYNFKDYMWNTGDTVKAISIIGTSIGEFKYWLTIEQNGCLFTDTLRVIVNNPVGINDKSHTPKMSIYPNPATDYIKLTNSGNFQNTSFVLFNRDGKILKTGEFIGSYLLITSKLKQGMYFVKMSNTNQVAIFKFIVIK